MMVMVAAVAACARRVHDENTAPAAPTPTPTPALPAASAKPPTVVAAPTPVAVEPTPPAPAAAPEPTPEEPPPAPEPPGVPEPSYAADALTEGSHRCAFSEAGSAYNRRCRVTQLPGGALQVVARGTSLNPQQGFTLTATGAAPRYAVQGSLTAFGACTGPFSGTMILQGTDRSRSYEVNWGQGCQITIQL
jgi:hypothetical protein